MSFKNWSLMTKVVGLLALLGVTAMVGAGFAAWQMNEIDARYSALLDGPSVAAVKVARANRNISDITAAIYANAAATTEEANRSSAAARDEAIASFGKMIDAAQAVYPDGAQKLEGFHGALKAVIDRQCAKAISLSSSTDPAENAMALDAIGNECRPHFRRCRRRPWPSTTTCLLQSTV